MKSVEDEGIDEGKVSVDTKNGEKVVAQNYVFHQLSLHALTGICSF